MEYWRSDKSFILIHFHVTNFDTVESFIIRYFTVFYFCSTCLDSFNIYSLFCWNSYFFNISWIFIRCYNFLAILFPINSPVASAALWTNFLEAVFRGSGPVLVAAFNNCLWYLLDRFLTNDKNILWHTFLFLVLEKNTSFLFSHSWF